MRVTSRGWGMLIAGIALAVSAAALQSMTAARIAAIVLTTPAVAIVWALVSRAWGRQRGLERVLRPATWQVERPGSVELVLGGSRLPPWASLRERVPASLRRRSLGARGYAVLPSRRGRLQLGPAVLQRSDPFAITTWRVPIGAPTQVLVWPRTEEVDDDVVARALEASSPVPRGLPRRTLEDVTVREYRRGDDLHRVHWRSSARHGELMVRHDEPTTTRVVDVALVLSSQDDDIAEWAVSAAASMALALLRNGYTVRVVTVVGGLVTGEVATRAGDALEVFALAAPAGPLAGDVIRSVQRSTSAGAVAVLDRPDSALDSVVAAGGGGPSRSTVLVIDPDDERRDLAAVLRRSGWLVAPSAGVGPFEAAWHVEETAEAS